MKPVEKQWIKKYGEGRWEDFEDTIIQEYPFTIFLNGEELVTLLCLPQALDYLAIGFLLSEGLIKRKEDILSLQLKESLGVIEIETRRKDSIAKALFGKRTMTTGCGGGTIFYNVMDSFQSKTIKSSVKISAEDIIGLMGKFNKASQLFQTTGGAHSGCISDGKELLLFHEDVGRHNVMDKIIGEALWRNIYLKDKLMITSGRISSEMLIKVAKSEIPILISRSAPTHLAIDLGKQLGITMIGFARGNRMNVYTEEQRVI